MTKRNSRPFSETVRESLQNSTVRRIFLSDALTAMAAGDIQHGKVLLREYVNGTVGFIQLGADLGKSPKSLMRMLGTKGNPNLISFFQIVNYLQKLEKSTMQIQFLAAA